MVTLYPIHHAAQIAYCLLAGPGQILSHVAAVAWLVWRLTTAPPDSSPAAANATTDSLAIPRSPPWPVSTASR